MKKIISDLDSSFPVVKKEDGMAIDAFRIWILQVSQSSLLIGTGSPSGVLVAQQGVLYMDETGIAGAVLFIKQLADVGGDRTLGWIAIG